MDFETLIDVDSLRKLLGEPRLAVVDCRFDLMKPEAGRQAYLTAHIPGARYADLNTAFLYRKHLVANCSCNGKDPFGLATFDVKTDPTLRPGDIVSTKEGLMTYSGRGGQSAFTPVAPSTLGPQLNSVLSRQKPASPQPVDQPQQEVEDEPGTIVVGSTPFQRSACTRVTRLGLVPSAFARASMAAASASPVILMFDALASPFNRVASALACASARTALAFAFA